MTAVVMYHYVRDTEGSDYPNLHSRKIEQFRFQLLHLQSKFRIGSLDALDHTNKTTALLTFDDGLKDHFVNALPVLQKHNMTAAFFVSSTPIRNSVVLDVHKIHLLLGRQSHEHLFDLLTRKLGPTRIREYEASEKIAADPSRFDNQKTILFKRLLQRDLEAPLRSEILHKIFTHFHADEEPQISQKLYMSLSELHELKAAGMTIGNHTANHPWLGHIELSEAKREILECEELLIEEGLMDRELKILAYPYGDSSASLENHLIQSGYRYAFTTKAEYWDPTSFSPMSVPRLDTNDVIYE